VTAWEDFGLDVAKVTVVVFGVALLAGAIWGLTVRLRDWRERIMWDRAEADAQAALDFAQVDFQAHVTQAFNIAMTGTPLYDQLAAEHLAAELDDDDAIARWLA
jgi:hypothetical protein